MNKILLILLIVTATVIPAAAAGNAPQHDLVDSVFEVIPLVLLGVIVGSVGTLVGAGGGFFVVPLLIIFFGFTPQHAIGTSMAVVFLNALSGSLSYMNQKKIDYELGVRFSVFAAPGVIIGAFVAQNFNSLIFSILFSMLLLGTAYTLVFIKDFYLVRDKALTAPAERKVYDAVGMVYTYSPDLPIGYSGSFIVGTMSGLFGIGGGLIHVPLMNFLGIPIHIATATSHFMIVITSFFGVLAFIGLKTVDMDYAVFLGIGSIFGAYYGAKLAALTESENLKKIIAVILILVSVKMLVGAMP